MNNAPSQVDAARVEININQPNQLNINENIVNGNNDHININDKIVQKKILSECFWNLLFFHLLGIFFICRFIYNTNYALIFLILFMMDAYDLTLILPKLYIFSKL